MSKAEIAGRMIFEETCDICGEFNGPSWEPGGRSAWEQLPAEERDGWTAIGAKVLEAARGKP